MGIKLNQQFLDQILGDLFKKKNIYGAVFCVSSGDSDSNLISASGDFTDNSAYYIASINKLFVSALILQLYATKKLDLDDKISQHLPPDIIDGLHIHNSRNYSNDITLAHLISQTSGLPCYLIDKQANGKKAMLELEAGLDQSWPFDKVIREVKKMKTHFPPGQKGRAKYIDTNHQILSRIIENVTGQPIRAALNNLFHHLHMTSTYVFENTDDKNFVPIRYKSHIIDLPLFLSSTKNDIISTARDQMIFLKAFFSGYFFPKERFAELEKWNPVFFPFQYGIGIQKFSLPRLFSPFRAVPAMIGHTGSTGSVAFYVPEMNLYITGSVNQQAQPNLAFQAMIKIIHAMHS